jgi:hypothetical protein
LSGGDQSANQGKRFLFPETKRFRNLQDLGKEGDCVTDILTDCAVDFIERKKDQPFLVYLSYYTVHGPITGKPEYVKKYKQKLAANPDANYHMKNPGKAAMMQSLDESVGRVIAKLQETDDDTLELYNLKNDPMEKENLAAYLPRKRNVLLPEPEIKGVENHQRGLTHLICLTHWRRRILIRRSIPLQIRSVVAWRIGISSG